LKVHAAVHAAISKVFFPTKTCFGAKFHMQLLKDSLLFCVFFPKHLSKRSSDDSSSYIGFKNLAMSSMHQMLEDVCKCPLYSPL